MNHVEDEYMTDKEFRAFLRLFMTHDDHDLGDEARKIVADTLNREAVLRGHEDWIEAYHSYWDS